MTELNYLDITKANDGHIRVPSIGLISPAITESIAKTALASFSDGAEGIPVKSLVADINPVQNLNGQSAPYPAGGGKNLVAPFRDAEGTSSYGLTMTPNADGSVRVHGTASNSSAVLLSMKSVNIPLPAGTYTFNIGITSSSNKVYGQIVTGAHIFFSRNEKDTFTVASDTTITRLDIGCNAANGEQIDVTIYPQLEAGSTATAYAPYSNICPITGWTGMNVVRNGFNQWDEEWEQGTINTSGQNAPSTTAYRSKNYIPIISGRNYYFHNGGNDTIGVRFYDADKNYIGRVGLSGTSNVLTYGTEYLPNGTAFLRFTNTTKTTYNNDISINYPSTDHDYHAYTGTTYPISWADEAGTVYGGTLDVTTGLLTVTHGIYVFSGSEVWTRQGTTAKYYSSAPDGGHFVRDTAKLPTDNNSSVPILTSIGSFNQPYNELQNHPYTMCIANDGRIGIHETLYGLMEGVQLVYELATPQTYQLTQQAVLTILGQNNIWADTGDLEVSYCADTKMYIDKVLNA